MTTQERLQDYPAKILLIGVLKNEPDKLGMALCMDSKSEIEGMKNFNEIRKFQLVEMFNEKK